MVTRPSSSGQYQSQHSSQLHWLHHYVCCRSADALGKQTTDGDSTQFHRSRADCFVCSDEGGGFSHAPCHQCRSTWTQAAYQDNTTPLSHPQRQHGYDRHCSGTSDSSTGRMKHINQKYWHFACHLVYLKTGLMSIHWIASGDMLADALTKAASTTRDLPPSHHSDQPMER